MFAVVVKIEVKADSIEPFMARMIQHAEDCLENEEGCKQFEVSVAADNPLEIGLYEVYDNSEAFYDVHVNTPYFKDFQETVKDWVVNKDLRHYNIVFPD